MLSKDGLLYWNGVSWVNVGFHTDSSGVVLKDEFEGKWKFDETDTYY